MRKIEVIKKGVITMLFLFFSVQFAVFAQTVNVTGTVKDNTGDPLPGVNIVVLGTTQGAVTDISGKFNIQVPADGSLVFNFIGFTPQTIAINGRQIVDVRLQPSDVSLEEIVVVGYGTQRREAVTGSVASVGGEEMREVASANITQALQGRISGVEMTQTSSKPGAEMQIRIRGTRSLTADNDPLVVLDGIPFAGKIGDISPNDIKSIDILKDASATAIYGSRGANGVILISSNKGQKGKAAQFSYNSYVGSKTLFSEYPMMNGEQFVKLRAAAGLHTNTLDESNDVDTNWQDLFYSNGVVSSHDLGVSGGTESGSYNFGLGYYNDEAVLPGQDYERFSMRASIDQEVGNNFRLGLSTNSNYSVNNGNNLGLYSMLSASPIADPYNADGTLKRIIRMPLDDQWVSTRESIEKLGDGWIDQTKAYGSYTNAYGEIKIPGIEGLKYRMNLGLNYRQSSSGSYTGEGVFAVNETTPSSATISNSHITNWVVENLVTYDRMFANVHQLNFVGLYSSEQTKYTRSHLNARDVTSDHFQYYNLGQAGGEYTVAPAEQHYELSGLSSWMGRVMYTYDNRYMLTATVRSDGSSRLAEGYKWHTYPAISAGWNIRNESFMDNFSAINLLKLRVGYGQTSNQAVTPYSTLGRLTNRPYNFGDEYAMGYYVSELPNPNLGWEYSETWNYGLDFSVFNRRLSGSVEYYVTNTKDLLLRVNLPSTTGVSSYVANVGKTQNKGVELSLNGVILEDVNGWSWDAGINFYANRNKLVELASRQEEDPTNWWFVGHPIDVIYDYEKVGLWQDGDPYLSTLEPGGNVGMIKVKYTGEYNADGSPVRQINTSDRQVMSVEPDFQGGFNTRVGYRGFDLTMIGAFKSGGILISTLHSSAGYLNMLSGRRNNVDVDYWTPTNTGAKYPKPGGATANDNPKYGSTLGYFDASYLKIRTITLGYNFQNNNWMDKLSVDRLRLYVTVQNPLVMFSPFHKETGMDPETNSKGNENSAVTNSYQTRLNTIGTNTPATRNYMIGLNLTF